jgi:hypothetical protein
MASVWSKSKKTPVPRCPAPREKFAKTASVSIVRMIRNVVMENIAVTVFARKMAMNAVPIKIVLWGKSVNMGIVLSTRGLDQLVQELIVLRHHAI